MSRGTMNMSAAMLHLSAAIVTAASEIARR